MLNKAIEKAKEHIYELYMSAYVVGCLAVSVWCFCEWHSARKDLKETRKMVQRLFDAKFN